jgi:hypothetical protein
MRHLISNDEIYEIKKMENKEIYERKVVESEAFLVDTHIKIINSVIPFVVM